MKIRELADQLSDIAVELNGDDYAAIFKARRALLSQQAEITQLRAKVAELEAENEDSRVFEIEGKQVITVIQVARRLCCHRVTVYRMAESGVIPKPINIGGKKKFLWFKADIDGFIKSRLSEGGAA